MVITTLQVIAAVFLFYAINWIVALLEISRWNYFLQQSNDLLCGHSLGVSDENLEYASLQFTESPFGRVCHGFNPLKLSLYTNLCSDVASI